MRGWAPYDRASKTQRTEAETCHMPPAFFIEAPVARCQQGLRNPDPSIPALSAWFLDSAFSAQHRATRLPRDKPPSLTVPLGPRTDFPFHLNLNLCLQSWLEIESQRIQHLGSDKSPLSSGRGRNRSHSDALPGEAAFVGGTVAQFSLGGGG